jgi:hypothetical protein
MRLGKTSWDFVRLHETSWDFMRLHETLWDFMRLHETSWDFMRLHETSQDFTRLHKTSWDFMRFYETSRDFMRLHETSWDFMRLHETSWDFTRLHETSKDFKRLPEFIRLQRWSLSCFPLEVKQTYFPWRSPENSSIRLVCFHDIFNKSGQPYSSYEIQFFKDLKNGTSQLFSFTQLFKIIFIFYFYLKCNIIFDRSFFSKYF